ncbi:MAG: hypothetical protein SF182_28415 [Deltaproteobacteria bacterium]|nr:hypothetical protein [Deltaproteobacteria bacterium]
MRTRQWVGAAAILLVCGAVQAQTPQLRIVGGAGVPGGTSAVTIELAGDSAAAAATADLDMRFPTDLVEVNPPVGTTCQIAPRLAATHQVGGRLLEPGLVTIAIFARNLVVAPLGDGLLATCGVHVLPDVEIPASAALTPEFAGIADSDGLELPVAGVAGAIAIGEVPCIGDCTGNRVVTVDEIIRGVRIVLGELPLSNCPAFDSGGGMVTISDLIAAVNNVLRGCPVE